MQGGKGRVEHGGVSHAQRHDGGQDDEGVPEDHRQHEPEQHSVQGHVVSVCGGAWRTREEKQTGGPEPGIACEHADGHEAGLASGTDGARRDVVSGQPGREREQTRSGQPRSPFGGQPRRGTGQKRACGEKIEEQALAPARHETAELQALSGDGQDQEGEPPSYETRYGAPRSPERTSGQPCDRAGRQRSREGHRLLANSNK